MMKILLIVIAVILSFIAGFFVYEIFFDLSEYPPPPYFVESPKQEYILEKTGNIYYIPFVNNGMYETVPVGKSDYDLIPYINKEAVIKVDYPKNEQELKGYLVHNQCIKGVCNEINPTQSYVITVNIKSIKLVTQ